MPLLKNNAFIEDTWVHLGAEDPLPEGGNVSIPFSRLKNEWESLAKFPGQLGTLLSNTDHAEDVAHFLPHLALVILPFPMLCRWPRLFHRPANPPAGIPRRIARHGQ